MSSNVEINDQTKKVNRPVGDVIKTVKKQKEIHKNSPVVESSDIDDSDKLNPYAFQTDGYDSDILEDPKQDNTNNDKQSVELAKITCPTTEDDYAKPINERWAKIIKDNWATKTLNENLRKIINNHKSPENCTLKLPSVNPQIWKLLSSWRKKSDVKFSSMVKSLNASLMISEQVQTGTVDLQFITQSTADSCNARPCKV